MHLHPELHVHVLILNSTKCTFFFWAWRFIIQLHQQKKFTGNGMARTKTNPES